ncbi:unnamed protein product [Euphydryas editha]|uniref:RNA-directed DNA polymerase n=1 Tax=Euphydryas editha TaxID=104508 RepID=A0AAU9V9Y6_EUPED|nr:unnamed protein product [Euphydryas editha]
MENESIDMFVLKLRKQAVYCKFLDIDEEQSGTTLEIARLYEMEDSMFKMAIRKEKEEEETASSVNRVTQEFKCFRCGLKGHLAKDSKCPAASEKCVKCGLIGHFAKCCKTKYKKDNVIGRKKAEKKECKKKKRYIKYVISNESDSESSEASDSSESEDEHVQVNSVFSISVMDNKCMIQVDKKFPCQFIIDSGASINIIDKHTFHKLIKSGFCCKLKTKISEKYFAYGGKELDKLGIFSTLLFSPDTGRKVYTNVLVYNGSGPSLLSRQTSIDLDLLRVGPIPTETGKIYSVKPLLTKEVIAKEYPSLFQGIGKLRDFKLTIPVDPSVKLVAQPVRRQPFNIRNIEEKLVKELLDYDIIEPVTGPTPCVSPSHIVKKKEKDQYRLVVDMRKANEAVMRERVPLPTFEELLADLNGCKFFSTLDLKYKRLFFGIRCASEIFQRVIAHLLQGINGVANSQDDIRIGGRTQEEHDYRLRQVLKRLQNNGLTLNEKKCTFGAPEITFLGHHISAAGIRPTRSNQQVIQEFRAPQNVAEVRSFLGLVNFSARFIPQFSTITAPLRELTKKDSLFVWTKEHENAFQKLKDLITSAPALGFYNKNAETTLVTDASPVGIAAVLIQKQTIERQEQPIIIKYISKALSPTEQRYSQTEKEALAIVWACETLYMYLIGKQFNIVSDHKPLEIICSANSKPRRNNIADPVSRLLDTSSASIKSTEDCEDQLLMAFIEQNSWAITIEEVQEATLKDKELNDLKQAIEKDTWPKEFRKYELIKTELCVINNILLRGTRIIIPNSLKERILSLAHEGHLSVNAMKAKLRSKVWWKGMDKDVEYWIDTSEGCRLVRQDTHPEPLTPTELPSRV